MQDAIIVNHEDETPTEQRLADERRQDVLRAFGAAGWEELMGYANEAARLLQERIYD
jgi:hypothetical protein